MSLFIIWFFVNNHLEFYEAFFAISITEVSGLKSTAVKIKLLIQCIMSNGIPAIHHANAVFNPPVKIYTNEHIPPKASPKTAEIIAQKIVSLRLANKRTVIARRGHTYMYITVHKLNPHMAQSKIMKINIEKNTFFPKYNV